MSLYLGTTEITNIDNLIPQTGLDITDMWFGSTNVYTVWATYEGTLPATINANGSDMKQYQIYGNTGGVGDDSGTAYGYVIPMNVRSLNIYNSAETSWSADGTILNDAGAPTSSEGSHYTTNFIPVEPGEAYYLAGSLANETRWRVYFYDSNKNWIRRTGSKSPGGTRLIAMDENASYFQLQVGTDIVSTSDWNFVHSRTAPEKYQPYSNTTTPIYIGDDPLDKDEYVDYQAQKVYRMIDGTLTPTDPPVPLPALPTCEGTTVIDYVGQSVAPEKVLLKYRKEGF